VPDCAAAVYWRRRLVALLLGLAVLTAGTWAVAGLVSGAARTGKLAAFSAGRDTSGRTTATVLGRAAQPSCPAATVVLTVFTSQGIYSAWQQPQFVVGVVSTASYACAFDIGAGHVQLRIAAGSAQIWTSVQCAEGQASQLVTLHRGVPTVVTMTWDEQYSAPGCPRPGRPAPAGSYSATASDGSSGSNSVGFRLG